MTLAQLCLLLEVETDAGKPPAEPDTQGDIASLAMLTAMRIGG